MTLAAEIENVSFAYAGRPVLKGISLSVERGEFLAIAGPNGAGKSTLLNLICGQLRPSSGNIRIDGANINSYSVKVLARKVAVVRQEFVPAFDFTAAEIVAMARTPYMSAFGFETQADREIINHSLEATQTIQFAARPIGQLSGGERQRVFIARALSQQSPLLLLDEPTNFLDFKHQVAIYDLLKESQRKDGKTIIAITHDINLAMQYCDKALLLSGQKYHIGNPGDVFTRQKIEEVFDVRIFEGATQKGKFFMPLGRSAKDA